MWKFSDAAEPGGTDVNSSDVVGALVPVEFDPLRCGVGSDVHGSSAQESDDEDAIDFRGQRSARAFVGTGAALV
ncbi:hypothetical protein GCM10025787_43250 [Saccharopolyspora rosea]